MKTTLLALALALTGLELLAQPAPGLPAPGAGRLPRFLGTNNIQGTLPRYQPPGTTPGTPGATPFSPGTAAGAPGTPGAASPATSGNTTVDPQANELQPMINWPSVDLNQALEIYAKYVGRTLLRANLPDVKITLKTETQLTKAEVIQALQAVLALNGIAVVNIGEKFVKVLPVDQANAAGAALDDTSAANLPNLGSYITHITQLKYVKPSIMAPLIQPFAKLQGGLFPIDDNGILVMRDYAENIKRMLEMIDKIDVSVPAEYISEVIPIRYAKVDDIASALNSLGGGGGGATVSIGSSQNSGQISGLAGSRMGSMGGMGGSMGGVGSGIGGAGYQSGGIGGGIGGGAGQYANRTGLGGGATPNPNGTPTGGSSFAQRLNSIINRASGPSGGSGQDQIQLFGQTKIIPNESSSTLLIYATRQDMAVITNIIAKLDVPLAQVLVEAIIMDVKLGSKFTLGVSAAQNPKSFTGANGTQVIGGGGFNNGPSFANFLTSIATNGTTSIGTNLYSSFANGLSSGNGLNYFGNIGQTWDVAVQALESDNNASIIQRPRIQTSQAKAAQFFVGETVPYVTSTYNGYSGGYGGSSYSQLSVGVELDVTPFINPEGLVVMDIQQEYDEISGSTS